MKTPWIEVFQSTDEGDMATFGSSNFEWQALFAFQISVLDHQSWTKLKWGFSAEALLTEALERQKLFLESQHASRDELLLENPCMRTLALRYINIPGEGLLLAVLGKISGPTMAEVESSAREYVQDLNATFPYDYTLTAGRTREEFLRISAANLLVGDGRQLQIVQIKRNEIPIISREKTRYLQGIWNSSGRAHEQVWRSLAARDYPVLINTTIRPTVLFEKDVQYLLRQYQGRPEEDGETPPGRIAQAHREWNEGFIRYRLPPWKKYFYVQVHIAAQHPVDESLVRSVGTALTLSADQRPSLGYQLALPPADGTAEWGQKTHRLDFIYTGSHLPTPRLSAVADLEEVFAVARIPYSPPDLGRPVIKYLPGIPA